MTTDKGYILDMARFLGLSLDYVTMLFITGSIFVKYHTVKSFFNVFEIIPQISIILRSPDLS